MGRLRERTPSVSFADSSLKREPKLLSAALASLLRVVSAAAPSGRCRLMKRRRLAAAAAGGSVRCVRNLIRPSGTFPRGEGWFTAQLLNSLAFPRGEGRLTAQPLNSLAFPYGEGGRAKRGRMRSFAPLSQTAPQQKSKSAHQTCFLSFTFSARPAQRAGSRRPPPHRRQ